MSKKKGKFAFDMGLDYKTTREKLSDLIAVTRAAVLQSDDILAPTRLSHYSVLLTQLVNGTRVSEALDAVGQWSIDGQREQQVKVRKLGHLLRCEQCGLKFNVRSKVNSPAKHTKETGHDEFTEVEVLENRLVVIPEQCLSEDRPLTAVTVGAVKVFALRNLHLNTHSLRYAKITSLSASGQPAQMIAKITHHRNLNFITDYTSQKAADEILRKSVG